jgi:protein-S-isoprenylcysteine O-methyltransferase Ste14
MNALPASTPEAARTLFPNLRPGTKLYDVLFGMPLAVWYGIGFYVQAPLLLRAIAAVVRPHPDPLLVIDVLSKSAALVFAALLIGLVVIRRPASTGAPGFTPKAVAFLGAFLGVAILCLPHRKIGWEMQLVSTALIMGGMGFAVYALFWLGRSISVLSEARNLVTGGPYSIVRHPLYLGEEAALVGVTLQFMSWTAFSILLLQIGFQLYRMGFEEQVMRDAFPEYENYALRVKRILPGIY